SGLTHISIVNIDAKNTQEVSVNLNGRKYSSVKGWILSSSQLQDHNTFEVPDKIKPSVFNNASMKGSDLQVKLPPFSVVVLELK
ncbi:MAG TPA: alpha-L-arabinofuranosidase C-terminal domain-containing protein, partial [Chitinophagaceae bacterium]|nr:alpha-L-arabinofuranosidase C-terminal domain-containing protein [Chitinophagaceae bacterium]